MLGTVPDKLVHSAIIPIPKAKQGNASGIVFDHFNGVKQGGVLSPVLFCLYIEGLFVTLSKAGVGCFIGNNFVGGLAYVGHTTLITLLAPSASALCILLAICDDYANEYSFSSNASKSKYFAVLPGNRRFLHDSLINCPFALVIIPSIMSIHLFTLVTSSRQLVSACLL